MGGRGWTEQREGNPGVCVHVAEDLSNPAFFNDAPGFHSLREFQPRPPFEKWVVDWRFQNELCCNSESGSVRSILAGISTIPHTSFPPISIIRAVL